MVIASLGKGVSTRLRLERKRPRLSRLPLVLYIELITAWRGGGRRQIGANKAEKLTTRSRNIFLAHHVHIFMLRYVPRVTGICQTR